MADLYQDTVDNLLDGADYLLMRTEFLKRKDTLEQEKSSLIHKGQKQPKNGTAIPAKLKKYGAAKKLNREMVECFVEGIRIFEGKRVEVTYCTKMRYCGDCRDSMAEIFAMYIHISMEDEDLRSNGEKTRERQYKQSA